MTREEYGMAYVKGFDITLRFLIQRGANFGQAQEFSQAAWVKGLERLSQLRDTTLLPTWVNSIALNIMRSHYRSLRNTAGKIPNVPIPTTFKEEWIDVQRAFLYCDEDDKLVMALHYTHGYSMPELEVMLGIKASTLKVWTHRARQSMKKRLTPSKPRV